MSKKKPTFINIPALWAEKEIDEFALAAKDKADKVKKGLNSQEP